MLDERARHSASLGAFDDFCGEGAWDSELARWKSCSTRTGQTRDTGGARGRARMRWKGGLALIVDPFRLRLAGIAWQRDGAVAPGQAGR